MDHHNSPGARQARSQVPRRAFLGLTAGTVGGVVSWIDRVTPSRLLAVAPSPS